MLAMQPEPINCLSTTSRKRNILQATEGDSEQHLISCKKNAIVRCEPLLEFADGYRLHLSSINKTGYKGVCYNPGKCPNKPYRVAGPQPEQRSLGYYETAVTAAVAYAKYVVLTPEDYQNNKKEKMEKALHAAEAALVERGVVKEHNGLDLHLSTKNATGYKGVSYKPTAHPSKPYQAVGPQPEGKHLGYFVSALGAAEAYARYVSSPSRYETAERLNAEEEAIVKEELLKGRGLETEAGGYKLHLSATRKTGYLGVRYDKHHPNKPYKAEACFVGKKISLGYHPTAIDAAVAFARYKEEPDLFHHLFLACSLPHASEGAKATSTQASGGASGGASGEAGVVTMTELAEIKLPISAHPSASEPSTPSTPAASRQCPGSVATPLAPPLALAPSPASVRTEEVVDPFGTTNVGTPSQRTHAPPALSAMDSSCSGMDELEMMIEGAVGSGCNSDFVDWCDEAYLERDAVLGQCAGETPARGGQVPYQTQMPVDGMPYALPCDIMDRLGMPELDDQLDEADETFWL